MKKHQIHNLIILDESGSMDSIKETVISGFNEIVQTVKGIEKQFDDQQHFISLISFNGLGNKLLHFVDPAAKLEQINSATYQPDATTPLYDAMGYGINKLKQYLSVLKNYNVLVTIFTDGEENASKEFGGQDIKTLVDELKPQGWTFTYIGTGHDIEAAAAGLSISNTLNFSKDEAGMANLFANEKHSRMRYSKKIMMNESVMDGYYDEKIEDKTDEDKQSKI